MATIAIRVPEELRKQMKKLRRVNWSEVARRAIADRIALELAQQGKDRAQIIEASREADELFEEARRRYGHVSYNSAETIRAWRDARYRYSSQTPQ